MPNWQIIAFNIRNLKPSIESKNKYKSHFAVATTLLSTWLKAKMVNSVKKTFLILLKAVLNFRYLEPRDLESRNRPSCFMITIGSY